MRHWRQDHPNEIGRDALARLPAPAALRREREARDKGMGLAAEKDAEYLRVARDTAEGISRSRHFLEGWNGEVSINDVRESLDSWIVPGIVWGNWAGSIFKVKQWERVGYTQARHEGSHARVVGVWRLKEPVGKVEE